MTPLKLTRLRKPGPTLLLLLAAGACATPAPPPHAPPPAPETAPSYFFHADGQPASMDDVLARAAGVSVIFMGELHGNQGAHALQLDLLEALVDASSRKGWEVVLSLEMFEAEVQLILDEYLQGLIPESQFLAAARPWTNYERDYRPLVELAREQGLRVIAANAPRRYVNRVARLGPGSLDDLSGAALEHLPPLPFPEPSEAYRDEWNRRMGGHGHDPAHGGDAALMAQALWDASMAWAIHGALGEGAPDPPPLVLHLTGSFHVENRTGTPEALSHYRPGVGYLIITTRTAADPADFEASMEGVDAPALADFILVTPSPS
jgi:uncharacterized iron-regulated protein